MADRKSANSKTGVLSPEEIARFEQMPRVPAYYRIYSLLKRHIVDGTLVKGAQLPTETELSKMFQVSRITAKRSLDELSREALVERHRGKGTYVLHEYVAQSSAPPMVAMLEEIESQVRHAQIQVLECSQRSPPAAIRQELGLKPGDSATYLVRIRSRQGKPFGFYTSWTRGWRVGGVSKEQWARNTRLTIFRKYRIELKRIVQILSAVPASEELAQGLDVAVGTPLLRLRRTSYAAAEEGADTQQADTQQQGEECVMDILEIFYRTDRFQYRLDLSYN